MMHKAIADEGLPDRSGSSLPFVGTTSGWPEPQLRSAFVAESPKLIRIWPPIHNRPIKLKYS